MSWFIRLRRNTLQRTVAQAMARRRLAAGMTRGASACAARREGELRRNSALIPHSLLRGASFFRFHPEVSILLPSQERKMRIGDGPFDLKIAKPYQNIFWRGVS